MYISDANISRLNEGNGILINISQINIYLRKLWRLKFHERNDHEKY